MNCFSIKQFNSDLLAEQFKDGPSCKVVKQVPTCYTKFAEIFELFSEQFISVLPNVYSRSEERGLGLLDHLMLIFGSTVRSSQPNFLPGKNSSQVQQTNSAPDISKL